MTSHDVVGPVAAAGPHPAGRSRRHARPDGDRRAGAGRRPGDPAAQPPRSRRQDLRGRDPARPGHEHRRRRRARRCRRVSAASLTEDAGPGRDAARSSARSCRCRRRSRRSRSTASGPTRGCGPARAVELAAAAGDDRSLRRGSIVRTGRRLPRRRRRGRLLVRHLRPGAGPRPGRGAGRRRASDAAAPDSGRSLHDRPTRRRSSSSPSSTTR